MRILGSLLLVGAFGCAMAFAANLTVNPPQDSYNTVHSGLGGGSSNHGAGSTLFLIACAACAAQAYPVLQFNLSAYSPHRARPT